MTGRDLAKLKDAGFRVFYRDGNNRRIMESVYGSAKVFGGPYKNKAELDRAWDDLMKNPKHISR